MKLFMQALISFSATALLFSNPLTASTKYVNIGTGGLAGVYYPTGGAICRLTNKEARKEKVNFRCSVESTGGSIYNLNTIRSGELDFGIVQSDWQFHAYNGTSKFQKAGPFQDLRAVFSIHAEAFTLLARADATVKTFDDLKGRRINIGNPGSGHRATMEVLMNRMGWSTGDFKFAAELKAGEQARALCDNKIDAFVYTVGHPNASIKEAATSCDVNIATVDNKAVYTLVDTTPYYAYTEIPGGLYKGNEQNIKSFGVKATLVSSKKVPSADVYRITKSVFENLQTFRSLHPAFKTLTAEKMLQGNSAPYHEGAMRYYREQGWLK